LASLAALACTCSSDQQDNIFWRRVTGNVDGRIEAVRLHPLP
jgi:hypothetical protein